MDLVVSASLNPASRSRLLAEACQARLQRAGRPVELLDLAESKLPFCDGATAYGEPAAKHALAMVRRAHAVFFAAPVYNYDVNAAAKNLVELTGQAWTGKVVSFLLAAGGQGSYMSVMGLANSLMLDFRCLIIPRFIYATGEAFDQTRLIDEGITMRLDQLVEETLRISDAIRPEEPLS
jgi:NAD(P)H-dependent FMN reductase